MSQTNPTPIDALPPAPSITNPATFSALADAFIGSLANLRTQINVVIAVTYNNAVDAYNNAVAAAASALSAANQTTLAAAQAVIATGAAASAVNSAQTQATSTSSLICSTGTQSLTLTQTGKLFSVGQTINISDSVANNVMSGLITAFNSSTGAMTVNVTAVIAGSGTYTNWIISVGAPTISSRILTIDNLITQG
jgi:hypothetical protein